MLPTLEPATGRSRSCRPVRAGDVVVVEHPERPGFELVKRVVAVPGDAAPDGRMLGADEYWVEGDAGGARPTAARSDPSGGHVKGTVVYGGGRPAVAAAADLERSVRTIRSPGGPPPRSRRCRGRGRARDPRPRRPSAVDTRAGKGCRGASGVARYPPDIPR